MRSLGEFAEPDGLSQLLLRLTVSSTVYCLSHMSSPWGFKVAARSRPAFHLRVQEGERRALIRNAGSMTLALHPSLNR
jgi:hypothetical protein